MATKQNVHAIIGTGETSDQALFESFKDVLEAGDAVGLVWSGKPTPTQEAVYDYVLDNEVQFVLYYKDGDKVPAVFSKAENGIVQKSRNPIIKAVTDIAGAGKLLALIPDDQDEIADLFDEITEHLDESVLILDLANGLEPITLVVPEVEEEETEEEESEPDDAEDISFTKGELEIMAAPAVKAYGAKLGAKAVTKSGIIAELFPADTEPLVDFVHVEKFDPEVVDALVAADKAKKNPTVMDKPIEFPVNSNEDAAWKALELSLTNIKPADEAVERIEEVREAAKQFGALILAFAPFGRERALAVTKLEESAMWAVKAIVLEGSK